jgi:acyl phosphate:glycerol-3-phosphate acyltransferase
MPWDIIAACGLAYLVGSIPVGYLIGRARGVNLFTVGSGNIGATNVGRVLGTRLGVICFALDLLKGAVPVAIAHATIGGALLPTLVATAAFIGHLFPIYLGFRGGKGVATGLGTVLVLTPIPAAAALVAWIVAVLASRMVSLASIAAVIVLSVGQWLISGEFAAPASIYIFTGSIIVIAKHRANIARITTGTENQMRDFAMREPLLRVLHIVAVGLGFGGAAFFNLAIAPSLFRTFDTVVRTSPSDRTAGLSIIPASADPTDIDRLGKALAGAAVSPIFPMYFSLLTGCTAIALLTAVVWRRRGRIHRARLLVAIMALATVLAGWPISTKVSELRLLRFSPDPMIAELAKSEFAVWHLVSLALSLLTVLLLGIILVMAAWLPTSDRSTSN